MRFYPEAGWVVSEDSEVWLSPQHAGFFSLLARHQKKLVPIKALFQALDPAGRWLWPTESLKEVATGLRRRFAEAKIPLDLKNVRYRGYILLTAVELTDTPRPDKPCETAEDFERTVGFLLRRLVSSGVPGDSLRPVLLRLLREIEDRPLRVA